MLWAHLCPGSGRKEGRIQVGNELQHEAEEALEN